MKPKTKRLGRKLLSVFTALSLSAAIVGTPVLPSLTANAGATINILTGRWGAVAMEYLERGILRTIGSAAAHAENEAVADILTTTKKLLASPMSSTLGDIKKMCAQMNAKLDNISRMISNNQDILVSKLDAVTEQQLKDNYTTQKGKLDSIKNVYANVINLFYTLNTKAQKVDLNDQNSIKELQIAYDSLNEIYEVANGITTRTGLEFNFSTDADTIAGIISAYPYSAAMDYSVDPGDKSSWNEDEKSDVPTMIDYYYQSLKYSDAFDHEYYRDMSAQYTYVAGVVSNYLEAYNLYVSYAAQLIYAGNVDGITNDRDKQREVDKLWDGYNKKCYVLLRALAQMMDGYDSKLSGVMREYDINTVIHFDNIKESINSGGVYEERMNDRKESKRKKTSNRMQAYQMRPFGSTTAYALRKTNSSQPAILMDDLAYYAFDIRIMAFPFYQNDCDGPTCDYRNLVDYAATSPTGWNPLSKNTQLDGLVNTTAFEKVTGQSNPSYITNYLKAHGITNDLPKMDSNNKWTLSNQYDWNYDPNGYIGNWDIDMHFYTINTLKKGTSMSTDVFDMEKIPDNRTGKEVSVFYTGEPQVAVYLPSNGGAQYQYSAVDFKGNAASANGGRNVYRSGGTVTLRIKPDEGKYIKSLRLCDRFVYDDDHSKGTLTQYVSEDDALYKADCGIYPDSDGYYTFRINVPFRDGSVILDLADIPSKTHTVALAESEDVVSGDQYDKDSGILTFSNFSGESSKKVNTGDTISVAVIPYTGYICTALEVKDSSGKIYEANKLDSSEYYSMLHGQTNFSFTMPDTDVTVKAIYEDGHNVELIHSTKYPNASLHFINEDGKIDDKSTVRTYIPGTTVNINATATNGHVISAVIVSDLTNREYISCDITENGVGFIMPDGNVQVEAQTQKQDMNTYIVKASDNSEVVFNFLNENGIVRNVPTIQAKEGETVRFTALSDVPEGYILAVSASASDGSEVAVTDNGDKTYSLTMPASNVTISGAIVDAPERHTATIVSFVNGTASFSMDNELLTVQAEPYEYVNFYVTTDRNNCFKTLKVTDSLGKDVTFQKSADNIIDGDKITYSLKIQMMNNDITIEGEMTESLVVTPDSSKFIYDENGEAIAYIEIADYSANSEYSKDAVRLPTYATSFEGRFVYDETHFPTHLKVVGETTGTVFYDSDQDSSTTTFIVNTPDLTQFGESLIVIPSFDSTVKPEPEPEKAGIGTYEELAAFAENVKNDYEHYGKAEAWLTANITVPEGSKWTVAIGDSEDKPFSGTFDGRGFAIIGLDINNSKACSLFGYIGEGGTVKDLAVIKTTFSIKSEAAGGIAVYNNGTIDHCISGINSGIRKLGIMSRQFNSSIYGVAAGGVAVYNNGTITGCRNSGYVNGQDVGGIAAFNNGTIYGCANNGGLGSDSADVKRVGGITAENHGRIEACYNSGKENGSINTVKAAVSVANDGSVKSTFYTSSGDIVPAFAEDMNTGETDITEKTIEDMLTAGFADELNEVTNDTVKWKRIEYNKKVLNQGFPIIRGRFIENIDIPVIDNAKMKIKAAVIKAMKINFLPLNFRSTGYNTMLSAAGSRTLTCAYDYTAADPNGTELPAELWCEGVTISVPVSTDDAQIIILDNDGEAYSFAPESIEDGMATFTLTEPAAFAVAENVKADNSEQTSRPINPDNKNVNTGDSSAPITAVFVLITAAALTALIAGRKKKRE